MVEVHQLNLHLGTQQRGDVITSGICMTEKKDVMKSNLSQIRLI